MSESAPRSPLPPWPWSFVDLHGREHASAWLRASESLTWLERLHWSEGKPWNRRRIVSRLARRLFPFSWKYLMPGDRGVPDPYVEFMRLPEAAQTAALAELLTYGDYPRRATSPEGPHATPNR